MEADHELEESESGFHHHARTGHADDVGGVVRDDAVNDGLETDKVHSRRNDTS
jgi:hypothetical protein